jgi:hypothetical protein
MRRTIFLALLAALLLAPSARAADPIKLLRDCVDDSVLQGNYSVSELREAQKAIPTDSAEYSDCGDVLSRALAEKTASKGNGAATGGGGGGAGTSSGGSSSTPDTGTGAGTPESTATPEPTPRPAIPPGPPTTADTAALAQALNNGPQPMEVGGKAVSPGDSRLAASVGRNSVPGSLFLVFGLLVLTGLVALGAPFIRRRRADARNPT